LKTVKLFFLIVVLSLNVFAQNYSLKKIFSIDGFQDAVALAVDQLNNIFIVDAGSNMVYKYSSDYKLLSSFGGFGWNEYSFDFPIDISVSYDLVVYVCDYNNNRIQLLDRNLNYIHSISSNNGKELFKYPKSIALSNEGELFIIDSDNDRIVQLDNFRNLLRIFGGLNSVKKFKYQTKIRVNNNRVFIIDNCDIVMYDFFGNYIDTYKNDSVVVGISFYNDDIVFLEKERIKFINLHNGKEFLILLDNSEFIDMYGSNNNFNDIIINKNFCYLLDKNKTIVFEIQN
jgi:DNA-binding beta-propeller fold protein YncE